MATVPLLCLLGGLALGAWTIRLRLGRTPAARGWAFMSRGTMSETAVLVVYPLATVVLLGVAAVDLIPDDTTAEHLVVLVVLAALLVTFAYLVLPVRIPRFVEPKWYRDKGYERGQRP